MSQSNTREGDLDFVAGEDLTGKEDRLVCVVNDGGVAKAKLPDDVANRTMYLLVYGAVAGKNVTLRPLSPTRNVRVRLKGACNPGDQLALAAIDGATDGQVEAITAVPDTYYVPVRAEEAGVDGQLVLARPTGELVTVA